MTEQLDEMFANIIEDYESRFIKHYFNKQYSELTEEERHEMSCFGAYGMTEWCVDNIK